jgi:hypothetical protein
MTLPRVRARKPVDLGFVGAQIVRTSQPRRREHAVWQGCEGLRRHGRDR